MKAIRVHHFGGLDSLVAEDVPRPAPGDGEVLLRMLEHSIVTAESTGAREDSA